MSELVMVGVESDRKISSLDIAIETAKEHRNILRDIRDQLEKLNIPALRFEHTYLDSQGQLRPCFLLDNEQAMTLASGYDVILRNRIIKRWFVLEEKVATSSESLTKTDAVIDLKANLDIYALLGVPTHFAQIESVKKVERDTGWDLAEYLIGSPAMSNIPVEEMMYEPTELAKELGFKSARAVNKHLESFGLQIKVENGWSITEKAKGIGTMHAWKRFGKTGYNVKWSADKLRGIV